MTSDTGQDDEHLFLADFYPELGEYLAGQGAARYDAGTGRARFRAWLLAHAEQTALAEAGETRAGAGKIRMEDPRETLDYSYQQQIEMLTRVRRGVADVATSRKRVGLQMNQLTEQATECTDQAREALRSGREDLAREALQRKASLQTRLNDLQTQYASLQEQEEKLTIASQRLQAKVEAFRARMETTVTEKPTAQVPDASAEQYGREPIPRSPAPREEGDSEFRELIEDSQAIQPGEAVSFTLLQEDLHSVLGTLSEREAGVISMRFGLTDGQPKTLEEIGKIYGVTPERIQQIESKTMSELLRRGHGTGDEEHGGSGLPHQP